MAGYSKTPLSKKLGYKAGSVAFCKNAPANYQQLLQPLPEQVSFKQRATGQIDLVHFFSKKRGELEKHLPKLMEAIRPSGMIWISWPKKASKVPTDITEDVIREIILPMGLVDVKVCAVDDTWSGLKIVIRRENR